MYCLGREKNALSPFHNNHTFIHCEAIVRLYWTGKEPAGLPAWTSSRDSTFPGSAAIWPGSRLNVLDQAASHHSFAQWLKGISPRGNLLSGNRSVLTAAGPLGILTQFPILARSFRRAHRYQYGFPTGEPVVGIICRQAKPLLPVKGTAIGFLDRFDCSV